MAMVAIQFDVTSLSRLSHPYPPQLTRTPQTTPKSYVFGSNILSQPLPPITDKITLKNTFSAQTNNLRVRALQQRRQSRDDAMADPPTLSPRSFHDFVSPSTPSRCLGWLTISSLFILISPVLLSA